MLDFKSYASSSKGNVHTVTDGQSMIMLDCGLPWRKTRQLMGFNTSAIDGIFVTHQHKDHCAGVTDAAKAGVDVYLLSETRKALGLSGHRLHDIEYGKPIRINGMRILPFPLVHDVPICGFLVSGGGEKLVYITDTGFVPNRMPANLNIVAIECNFCPDVLDENVESGHVHPAQRSRLLNSHFGLNEVEEFFKANKFVNLREVHIMHLSDGNSDENKIIEQVQAITGVPVYVCGT